MSQDIIPEHTRRMADGQLNPDIVAAYAYVDRVSHTADLRAPYPAWHGWALREAFLAGVTHGSTNTKEDKPDG